MATFTRDDIRPDMTVYSADGHKLGKVYIVEGVGFHIEKGFFFPKDYLAHYEDVREINAEGQIALRRNRDELLEGAASWEASALEETERRHSEPIAVPQRPQDDLHI